MPTADSRNGKSTELQAKIDQSLDELGAALEAGQSDQMAAFLSCLAKFHRYSFGNVLLISLQRPDATHVAGFQAWKTLGRQVRKGERGIAILAPVTGRRKRKEDDDPETDTMENDEQSETRKKVIGFRAAYVFDVTQTDGEPLPEFARVAGDPGSYVAAIRQQIRDLGIELETDDIPGGADGVSRGGTITVRPGLPPAEEFSVLVHECAHERLHRGERRQETTKLIRETEAEAVAFTVCRAIGLETGTASSDYIQLYNGSRETLQESLHYIRQCTAQILDGLLSDPPPPPQPTIPQQQGRLC